MIEHPDTIRAYLDRLYDESRRRHACHARAPEGFAEWQRAARKAYPALLGVDRISRETAGHEARACISPETEDRGSHMRQKGRIETEPGVEHLFFLLRPKGDGPFPLAVTPHGHENGATYAGIWHNEHSRKQIEQEDQAVAVQAAEHGFLTIATATVGTGSSAT
jgi:hypothetical protein